MSIENKSICDIARSLFKKHKVEISDAINTTFPFLEYLNDHGFITNEIYKDSLQCLTKRYGIQEVIYDVLTELEKTFDLSLLRALFSKVIMKKYPDLYNIYRIFKTAIPDLELSPECEMERRPDVQLSLEQGTVKKLLPSLTWLYQDPSDYNGIAPPENEFAELLHETQLINGNETISTTSDDKSVLETQQANEQCARESEPAVISSDEDEPTKAFTGEQRRSPGRNLEGASGACSSAGRSLEGHSGACSSAGRRLEGASGACSSARRSLEGHSGACSSAGRRLEGASGACSSAGRSLEGHSGACSSAGRSLEGASGACSSAGRRLEGHSGACSSAGRRLEGASGACSSAGRRLEGASGACSSAGRSLEGASGACSSAGRSLEGHSGACSSAGRSLEGDSGACSSAGRRLEGHSGACSSARSLKGASRFCAEVKHPGAFSCTPKSDPNEKGTMDLGNNSTLGKAKKKIRKRKHEEENVDFSSDVLPVTCGDIKGILYMKRLEQGTTMKCIKTQDGNWFNPIEFQVTAGYQRSGDWKRKVYCGGKTLRNLIKKGILPTLPRVYGRRRECENSELCDICLYGANLFRCDTCLRYFHEDCHIPPVETERSPWSCTFCRMSETSGSRQCLREPEVLERQMGPEEQLKCEFLLLKTYSERGIEMMPHNSRCMNDLRKLKEIKTKLCERGYPKVGGFMQAVHHVFQDHQASRRCNDFCLGIILEKKFEQNFKNVFAVQ